MATTFNTTQASPNDNDANNNTNNINNNNINNNNNNNNRKRQRLLSNGSSNIQMLAKKLHYYDANEVINLDSDDEDYVFNNNNNNLMNNNNDINNNFGNLNLLNDNHYIHHNNINNNTDTDDTDDTDDMDIIDNIDDKLFQNNNNNNNNNLCLETSTVISNNTTNNNNNNDNHYFNSSSLYHDLDNEDAILDFDNDNNDTNNNHNHIDLDIDLINDNETDSNNIDNETENIFDDNNAISDFNENNYLDDSSYSNYFENYSNNKKPTRHMSISTPFNNFFNKFLKKGKSNDLTFQNNEIIFQKKKKRTKSLPQLAYSKLTYSPALDRDEVSLKIGEIQASLIQRYTPNTINSNNNNNNNNYTYNNNNNNTLNNNQNTSFNNNNNNINIHNSNKSYSLRKSSFKQNSLSSNHSYSSYSKSNTNSNSSATSSYDEKILNDSNRKNINLIDINDELNSNHIIEENDDENCDDEDGYYIVKNDSTFANGRFIIKKLLGQGTFGKVVKAYDQKSNSLVAIKIIKSIPKYREASKIELRVLTMLKKHDPNNKFQCIHLRECFDYRNHICIVTDLLKISLFDFMQKNQFLPFPGSHIQAMTKQLLRSVAFLHDLNLIHTDLKPENILIKDSSYCKKIYHKIDYENNDKSETLFRKILKDPKIYTIDFGSAIFQDEYHSSIISTRHYRAPEIILGVGWSFPCDMWSVGSILIELLTGEALFKTHENEQHLAMMEKVIGEPVDLEMVRQCITLYRDSNKNNQSNSRFDSSIAKSFSKRSGKLLFPKSSTEKHLIDEVNQFKNIEELVEEKTGFKFNLDFNVKDSMNKFNINQNFKHDYIFWYYYIDLIKKLLVFDPTRRLTAKQALKHKWFEFGILDDGIQQQ